MGPKATNAKSKNVTRYKMKMSWRMKVCFSRVCWVRMQENFS
jgi:hypothetical protein